MSENSIHRRRCDGNETLNFISSTFVSIRLMKMKSRLPLQVYYLMSDDFGVDCNDKVYIRNNSGKNNG